MWTLGITWLIALGLGIAAALMMEHTPTRRPGCSIPVNPFINPHSQTVTDPGFNFVLSFVILDYLIASAAIVVLGCDSLTYLMQGDTGLIIQLVLVGYRFGGVG